MDPVDLCINYNESYFLFLFFFFLLGVRKPVKSCESEREIPYFRVSKVHILVKRWVRKF